MSASSSPQREDWLRKTLACQPTVVTYAGDLWLKGAGPARCLLAASPVCAVIRRDQPQVRYGPVTAYASLVISLLALVVAGSRSPGQDRGHRDDRRRDELTPVLKGRLRGHRGPGAPATLKVALADGIDALDEVVVPVQGESGTDPWGTQPWDGSDPRQQLNSPSSQTRRCPVHPTAAPALISSLYIQQNQGKP